MSGSWTARVRRRDFSLADPIEFVTGTLVENYNVPDMFVAEGRLDRLRAAMEVGAGVVLYDDTGAQRFSGFVRPLRQADGTGTVTFTGDLARLAHRYVYPVYNAQWTTAAQTAASDNQSGPAESRLLTYIARNAGSIALNTGGVDRRVPTLRVPVSSGRGPTARTTSRFDNLLELAAGLAESANLRLEVRQTYEGTTPFLDVVLSAAPDLSSSIRFGLPEEGGPWMIASDSSYTVNVPTGTAVLDAAGGEGVDRFLMSKVDADAEALWGLRIESFLDNRGSGDLPGARATLAQATRDHAAATTARTLALQRLTAADVALDTAKHNLAQAPSSGAAHDSAQAAKDKAQSNYDDASSKVTEATSDLVDKLAAKTFAQTAVTAAQASDTAEITQNMTEALADLAGTVEISIPLAADVPGIGTTIPIGAKVQASIDGVVLTERIRQVTTTIAVNDGEATAKVVPLMGSPDVQLLNPTQRLLAQALKRISQLERTR